MTQQRQFQVGDRVVVNGYREKGDMHSYGTNDIMREWERKNIVLKVKDALVSGSKFRCSDGEHTCSFAPSEISLADDHQAQSNADTHDVADFIRQAYERGETLQTRDSLPAYIFAIREGQDYPVVGMAQRNDGTMAARQWAPDGSRWSTYRAGAGPSPFDLMPPTRTINGFEVPRPLSEAPQTNTKIWVVDLQRPRWCEHHYWGNDEIDAHCLKHGLVFMDKDAAIATAKAMVGVDPSV